MAPTIRQEEIVLSRFRIEHIHLTHSHLLKMKLPHHSTPFTLEFSSVPPNIIKQTIQKNKT